MEVSIGGVAFCSPAILDLRARPFWMRSYPALHLFPTKARSSVAIGLQFPSAVCRDCHTEPQFLGTLDYPADTHQVLGVANPILGIQ